MNTNSDFDENEGDSIKLSRWFPRLILFTLVIFLCSLAALILFFVWEGSQLNGVIGLGSTRANLNPVERLYLRGVLAARADELNRPVGAGNEPVLFKIEVGQSGDVIANNLVAAGMLNDTELFTNYLKYYGLDSQLAAGTFELNPGSTIPMLANTLIQVVPQSIELRFLEGWRIEEMVDYLEAVQPADIDPKEFQRIALQNATDFVGDHDFLSSLPPSASLEGFLFPDTYAIPIDADASYLVDLMLNNFDNRVTPSMRQSYGVQGLSVFEAITLASVVQREAVISEEQPTMVSVFTNRLNAGMPLQADPTVQFALGYQPDQGTWWKSPLSLSDLEIDSSYNTYLYFGLPPGPINNPGLSALEAVAFPDVTDYLFFVAGCDDDTPGSHVFSLSFEEHLAHVERCRE